MSSLLLSYLRKFPLNQMKGKMARKVDMSKFESPMEYENSQGVKFHLDLNEYQMKQIFLFDSYEQNTVRQMLRLIDSVESESITCIDVGTNIGFFSLTLAKHLSSKEHQIHCFEPNPYTLRFLEKNLALNPELKKTISLNKIGLGDQPGSFTLNYNHKNTGSANIYSSNSQDSESAEVEIKTLDTYCDENNIKSIDLMKVDIEGAELAFLKGAKNIIERSKNMILIMEIMEDNCSKAGYTSEELYNEVTGLGFKPFLPKGWPFGLKSISELPKGYEDNIIFIK